MGKYVEYLKDIVEKYRREVEDLKEAIKVMEKAGEDTTHLRIQLSQIEEMLKRWENALKEEG